MKIIECQQLSAEWWELHRGRPTSSRFDRIITPKTGKLSAAADELICELIAEHYHLGPLADIIRYQSAAMKNGTDTEAEARRWYEMEREIDVQPVGFILSDDESLGCSPDGLIGNDGALEIKCPQGKAQVRYLLDGVLPPEYKPQVHGTLIVAERKWVDFLSYRPGGLPPFVVRVTADDYTESLRSALGNFTARYQEILQSFTARAA